MIVRHLDDITGTARDVEGPTWRSRRLLLAGDGMGFSFHMTTMAAGTATRMHYRHHLEAVYCVEGDGEIVSLEDWRRWRIRAGTMYALDQHDPHELRAWTELRLLCVFNPPVTGRETHDATGAYPPPSEEP